MNIQNDVICSFLAFKRWRTDMKMARWLANADGWWSIGRNSLGSAGLVVAVNNPPTSYYYHQLYRRSACAWIGIIIVYQMYILGTAAHLSSRLLLGSSSCAFIVWSSLWANYVHKPNINFLTNQMSHGQCYGCDDALRLKSYLQVDWTITYSGTGDDLKSIFNWLPSLYTSIQII